MPGRIVVSSRCTISAFGGALTASRGPTSRIVPSSISTAAPPRIAGAPVPSTRVSARTNVSGIPRLRGYGSIGLMRVTGIKTYLFQPPDAKTACFLKVDTDEGIFGWGEAYTLTGREPTLERLVQDLGE